MEDDLKKYIKWTQPKINKNEDDLKKIKNEDNLHKKSRMKTTSKKRENKDDLKKNEDNLKKIIKKWLWHNSKLT